MRLEWSNQSCLVNAHPPFMGKSRAFYLAPRPGLEPGTYGLTESQAA